MEVILTISGTPRWANGGKNPNAMPKTVADFGNFARAIASRYSGRFEGYPVHPLLVRLERAEPSAVPDAAIQQPRPLRRTSELREALAAAYTGIKAANPFAQVGIGETSPRGSDKPAGLRPSHSPGKFAELVAKANPKLKFDAWSHHPYPSNPKSGPGQLVKWPNVSLASLPKFDQSLKRWFKRRSVPIWITEYGHQTKPPDSFGVSYATQAAYIQQSMSMAASFPFVGMFIWFVFQDDQGQPWESGVYTAGGLPKGTSPARFAVSARPLDARNGVVLVRGGSVTPLVNLYARRYCSSNKTGTPIGMTWRVFHGAKLIAVDQQSSPLRIDCTISARLRFNVGEGADVHRDVRLKRLERRRPQPPPDDSGNVRPSSVARFEPLLLVDKSQGGASI